MDFLSNRRPRREDRARRRSVPLEDGVESLEGRQLLSYSPLGSLPDLTVQGQVGAIAAYGAPLSVTLNVYNRGASSSVEPLNLQQNATSTATSAATNVGVYISRFPHAVPGGARSQLVGEVAVPAVLQNSVVTVNGTVTLPSQPSKFPGNGGTIYVSFRANDLFETRESDRTNNSTKPIAVQVTAALPDLTAVSIDAPSTLHAGDVIAPSIKVANYGTVNTNTQGPVTVLLVASTSPNYGPTDVILAQYTITSLPGLSQSPSNQTVLGDVNLDNPPDTITLSGANATLPASSTPYYIGVIVDPFNTIREIHEIGVGPSSSLQLLQVVQPTSSTLPSAGVVQTAAPASNVFPFPAYYPLVPLQDVVSSQTDANQVINKTGGGLLTSSSTGASTFLVTSKKKN